MAPVIRGLPNTTDTTKMIRLDQLLVSQGLASSRTRAQRLIKNGRVFLSDGTLLSKPSEKWPTNAPLRVEEDPVGVEVGHDQLASHLRSDPRVTCLEGLNARHMSTSEALLSTLAERPIDLAVMDVSFISQTASCATLVATQRWSKKYAPPASSAASLSVTGKRARLPAATAIGSFFFSPASGSDQLKVAGGRVESDCTFTGSPCSRCSHTSNCSKAIFTPASLNSSPLGSSPHRRQISGPVGH